ncbi:MAG: 23S rRNA (guanosine(2251)-2'-O)-methyltransferase RlmB [Rhodothermales bacterium]
MGKKNDANTSLIIGRNPVRESLEQGGAHIEKVMLQKGGGRGLDAIRRAATRAGVPVQYVPVQRLNQVASGVPHQGVVALAAPISYQDVDDLLTAVAPDLETVQREKPILLLLDQLEDPRNFGAILRTAVAAGVGGVIVPKHRMASLNAAAIKTSAGTAMHIPIARTGSLADVVHQLKERGYWVVGASGDGETSAWEMDWDRPLALVMGSEGKGLRPRVADACDYRVSIPMRGNAESLNVSVAAGILLFAAAHTRSEDMKG